MRRSVMLGGPGRQGPDAGLPGAAPGPAGLKWRELTPVAVAVVPVQVLPCIRQ